jgi:membrane protein DedA with SNARE-associated domain
VFGFIERIIGSAGYPGIALLMLLENVLPPLPSELIMPMAGFVAASGELSLVGVILAGTLGSVAGALPWFYLGKVLGRERLRRWAAKHGRWLTLTAEDLDRVDAWFRQHCGKAVFFGRLVPAVRTLISVPAGLFDMGLPRFLLFTALGSGLWSTALAWAGYSLRDGYAQVEHWLNPMTNVVVGAIVLVYLYRVVTWRRGIANDDAGSGQQHGAERPGDEPERGDARNPESHEPEQALGER